MTKIKTAGNTSMLKKRLTHESRSELLSSTFCMTPQTIHLLPHSMLPASLLNWQEGLRQAAAGGRMFPVSSSTQPSLIITRLTASHFSQEATMLKKKRQSLKGTRMNSASVETLPPFPRRQCNLSQGLLSSHPQRNLSL